jgi:vacuolar-type H+-ATPase subunit C/Vma6
MAVDHHDWNFQGARLHARRARICEGQRLLGLCGLDSVVGLVAELGLAPELASACELERWLVRAWLDEVRALVAGARNETAMLAQWMLARLELELLKAALRERGSVGKATFPREMVAALSETPALEALLAAPSSQAMVALLPDRALRQVLKQALTRYRCEDLFLFESALSQAYWDELVRRARRVPGPSRPWALALVSHEVDTFHLMLVARGRFHAGLSAESLGPLHVEGTAISRARFCAMLASTDLGAAAALIRGELLDGPLTVDAAASAIQLERRAWARYARLAERVFRHCDMGPGALIGYLALRRIEVANLTTLAQGLRLAVPAELLRARMLPGSEVRHAA